MKLHCSEYDREKKNRNQVRLIFRKSFSSTRRIKVINSQGKKKNCKELKVGVLHKLLEAEV